MSFALRTVAMQQYSLKRSIYNFIHILFRGVQVATLGATSFIFVSGKYSQFFKFIVSNPALTPFKKSGMEAMKTSNLQRILT